jgi:hypothetical protein
MAIRNIIQKAEQEYPPTLKQELDPIAIAELALLSGYVNTVDSNLATTGSTLNTKIDNLSGYSNNTFYTNDNPSGFITGVDTSSFYTNDNPSGFITGVDTSSFYTNDNPSGFITNENVVFTSGDQTISGNKTFSAQRYVFSGAEVIFVDNTGIVSGAWQFVSRPTVNSTGVVLSGEAYPSNNPSGFITKENVVFQTGNQTISGVKTFINNTNFSGTLNFNTSDTGEPVDGQMNWSSDYGTLQIGMNGGDVINPVGFKSFYRVKAAQTIRKGTVVMAVGGVGNSEYILAQEAQNIGASGQLIMGVSAEEITQNNFGDVVAFGAVRGVNTSTFPSGSILYYDALSTGGLTNIPPNPPNAVVTVALNTTSSNNGIVFVRVTAGSQLGVTDSNVKFTNLQDKDFIKYNLASGLWINGPITTGDVSGIENLSVGGGGSESLDFKYSLVSGFNTYTVPLTGAVFSNPPHIHVELQVTGDNLYFHNISNVTTSGFQLRLSSQIIESGVIAHVRAKE